MMITRAPGTSSWTVAVRLRLSRSTSPKSRRITSGLASRALASASSTSAEAARTLKPGWVRIIAAIPSRNSRLSSIRTREMGLSGAVMRPDLRSTRFPARSPILRRVIPSPFSKDKLGREINSGIGKTPPPGGTCRGIPDTPGKGRRLLVDWHSRVARQQATFEGEAEQLGAALEAELVTQAFAVGLDGLDPHGQLVGGFLVGVPLRQQPEHLTLPPAQRPGLPGLRRAAGEGSDLLAPRQCAGTREIHEGAAAVDGTDRGQQLDVGRLFDDVAARAGQERGPQVRR